MVANAGDSRCVLCRGGQAVELSFDHKPEDEPEKARIEKAGGKVTGDGRVNGGLNLSRAIGKVFGSIHNVYHQGIHVETAPSSVSILRCLRHCLVFYFLSMNYVKVYYHRNKIVIFRNELKSIHAR